MTGTQQVAWLIERGSPAEYLRDYEPGKSSPEWTNDPHLAWRFADQKAADEIAANLHPSFKARVCDHMFGCGNGE